MVERIVVELDRIEVYVLSRGWEDVQLGGEGELLIPSQPRLDALSPCNQINCTLPDQSQSEAREMIMSRSRKGSLGMLPGPMAHRDDR